MNYRIIAKCIQYTNTFLSFYFFVLLILYGLVQYNIAIISFLVS
jgi:hypothetical protein